MIFRVFKLWVFQDFTLDMYFRQFWQDPRLSFNEPGLEKLVVGAEYIKLIWVPDTFFVNEKTAYFHDATTENQFLRILHTGEILRSIRWVVPNMPREPQLCMAILPILQSVWVQLNTYPSKGKQVYFKGPGRTLYLESPKV